MQTTSRRNFIRGTAAAGLTILTTPGIARGAAANGKLRMACIGAGGMAGAGISAALGEHLVAVAEVDPQGHGAGNLKKAKEKFGDLKVYTDYRELFDKHPDLDAVWVGCPDHNHFGAGIRALESGAALYCEKPLTWSIGEARKLRDVAAEKKLATQMGNQGHSGDAIRKIVEHLRGDQLGEVRKVVAHMGKGWGASGMPPQGEKPAGLDWDSWLGPVGDMPFLTKVHPGDWRKYVPFGTGTLGDMACHTLDGAIWGLELTDAPAFEVEAESGRAKDGGHPVDSVVRWDFPAIHGRPPVSLWWYQGGAKPELPEEVAGKGEGMTTTYFGDKGFMVSNSHCGDFKLLPESFASSAGSPDQIIPRVKGGHHGDFLRAARESGSTLPSSHFGYAAVMTEIILAGVIAQQIGGKLNYDLKAGRFTNNDNANALLWRKPRAGWEHGYPA